MVDRNLPDLIREDDPSFLSSMESTDARGLSLLTSFNNDQSLSRVARRKQVGWLYKKGAYLKQWKRRYFTLTKGALAYQTKEHGAIKGRIDLTGPQLKVGFGGNKDISGHPCWQFSVMTSNRKTFHFAAMSRTSMVSWVQCIQREASKSNLPQTEQTAATAQARGWSHLGDYRAAEQVRTTRFAEDGGFGGGDEVDLHAGANWVYESPPVQQPKNPDERMGDFPLGGTNYEDLRKTKDSNRRQWDLQLRAVAMGLKSHE
jgi:hypothetical protein